MADKQECFIIAPISTPAERTSLYLNDADHCEHVIEHLLVPAVEKAGFKPVRPKAKGANLIHADIVQHLQTASLVLCDMSGLNPNVFFELGVRTAMNKPICLTIDKATKDAPFDLNVVNHHAYVSDLRPWILPGEIDKLATHIEDSATSQENALWKYFALRISAELTESKSGQQSELSLLRMEIEALRKETRSVATQVEHALPPPDSSMGITDKIFSMAEGLGLRPTGVVMRLSESRARMSLPKKDTRNRFAIEELKSRARGILGIDLEIRESKTDSSAMV